jgi:uncharacterized protein
MKKFKDIFAAILPFLAAIGIQIMFSVGIMFVYGLVAAFSLLSKGDVGYDAVLDHVYGSLNSDMLITTSAITAIILFIVFGWWYRNISIKIPARDILNKFSLKKVAGIVLLGIGLQLSLSLIMNIVAAIKPEWFDNYSELMEQLGMGNTIMSAIYIGLIAPFSEEFIFRGVILKKAQKVFPLLWANVFQAVLFGIYHGNIVQGIYAFFLGMFLGFVYYKLESIYASILLHMVINIGGMLLGYINTEESASLAGLYILIYGLGIIAAIGGMIILRKKDKTTEDLY